MICIGWHHWQRRLAQIISNISLMSLVPFCFRILHYLFKAPFQRMQHTILDNWIYNSNEILLSLLLFYSPWCKQLFLYDFHVYELFKTISEIEKLLSFCYVWQTRTSTKHAKHTLTKHERTLIYIHYKISAGCTILEIWNHHFGNINF